VSDLREDLVKLLNAIEESWREHDNEDWTRFYADRLLPFVQAQVDAAVNAEYSKINDEITAAVDAAAKAERERCAKIAESGQFYEADKYGRAIAAAIREGEKP